MKHILKSLLKRDIALLKYPPPIYNIKMGVARTDLGNFFTISSDFFLFKDRKLKTVRINKLSKVVSITLRICSLIHLALFSTKHGYSAASLSTFVSKKFPKNFNIEKVNEWICTIALLSLSWINKLQCSRKISHSFLFPERSTWPFFVVLYPP